MTSFLALRASVCVCPSVMCYGYGPPVRRYRSTNIYSAEVGRWHLDGREWPPVRNRRVDPLYFFTPERAQFLLYTRCLLRLRTVFEFKFSGRRPVRWSFFVTGAHTTTQNMYCVGERFPPTRQRMPKNLPLQSLSQRSTAHAASPDDAQEEWRASPGL